jgi:pyruvate formate-lyase/glycerol dehydratase family glycyl radical enzyme
MAQPDDMFLPLARGYLYLEGWAAAGVHSLPVRNAAALANVFEKMPVLVFPGEILVGESGDGRSDDLVNFWPQNPESRREEIAQSPLTDEQKVRMQGWLEGRPFDFIRLAPVAPAPSELTAAQEHGVVSIWGTSLNHSIRDYAKVLRLGFSGIRAEVEAALNAVPLTDPDASRRRANLIAFQKLCLAAESLGKRHAAKALEMSEAASHEVEAERWRAIAEVCERVPSEPARTFHEAVQALWFAHILTVWEDGINANGIGRIDQMLWPYLERDLANGVTTWEEAAELLGALWCKLYRPYDVQQMMIGGLHHDGSDATNPLSYLVLDVTEGMDFIRCLSARLHAGSPRDFVSRCVDLVAKGGGIPFFFNDEALVPALVSRGVPLEDARGYAAIGCIEITIPGMAYPHAVSNWINVAKCLELALNDGKDLLDGAQLGPRTGTLAEFAGMDDVLAAYTKQLETFAELVVYGSNACETGHRSQFRLPYLSLLTDDCIGRGLDIIEGGARYNYHCSAAMGIPNAADSLAALQSAVFGDRSVTPADMLKALRSNYEGDEVLRLQLRNRVPKYGNDEALPDGFAADLTRQYCDLMAQFRTVGGGTFFCHLFTFTLMLPYGKLTGASPDGRRAGEPLAYSVSPAQGRDKEGLTAVMNSLARLPHHLVAASSSAIVEVDPGLLEGSSREAFVDLLVTSVKQGVGQLQFNVVSAETLRAAQDDPEKYSNLCVRVSGFSQQFRLLDREMQEHIIARTKHTR